MSKDGFESLSTELQQLASVITDERVHEKAIEAGVKPLVPIVQRALRPHRRNSRRSSTLDQEIVYEYDKKDNEGAIGWSRRGYYGRFYEHGYRPITGTRKMVGGRLRWKNKRPSGHATIQRPYIKTTYEAESENVTTRMIGVLQGEIKNKI